MDEKKSTFGLDSFSLLEGILLGHIILNLNGNKLSCCQQKWFHEVTFEV